MTPFGQPTPTDPARLEMSPHAEDGQVHVQRDPRDMDRQLREQAREIAELRRSVRDANEIKSDFLAVVNHELRTPLSALLGYLFLIQRRLGQRRNAEGTLETTAVLGPSGATIDDVRELLEKGRLAGARLVRLLDELAAMEWIHRQDLPLDLERLSMDRLVAGVCDEVRLLAPDRRVRLEFHCPDAEDDGAGLDIVGDPEKLRRLLEHLVGNAVKYTPDGGCVRVEIQAAQSGDGSVHVTVRDGGVGIPARDLEKIFEPFYTGTTARHHSSGKTKFMGVGLGLGLPVSRGIARAHGGELWAESAGFDPERLPGARFHLLLPPCPPERPSADDGQWRATR
jgi:signal transduction histidine kinase